LGQLIRPIYEAYCRQHKVDDDTVSSPMDAHPGMGMLESSQARENRILKEKADELARKRWRNAGEPPGGHHAFLEDALSDLRRLLADG